MPPNEHLRFDPEIAARILNGRVKPTHLVDAFIFAETPEGIRFWYDQTVLPRLDETARTILLNMLQEHYANAR
jgi:hypothetical protein